MLAWRFYTITRYTLQGNSRYSEIRMDFTELFRQHIAAAGISQAELARRANDHQSHINAALQGRAKPSLQRVAGWADALGLVGVDRRTFVLAAVRCHVPTELAGVIDEMLRDLPVASELLLNMDPASIPALVREADLRRQLSAMTAERDKLRSQLREVSRHADAAKAAAAVEDYNAHLAAAETELDGKRL
jgi:transcriptional regulator with XRE-family HTH domain